MVLICIQRYEAELWEHHYTYEDAVKDTAEDGTITKPSVYFDIRFGNLCNLKCRSCGPTDSSEWYDDHVKLWGKTYDETTGTVQLEKNKKGRYQPTVDIYNWHESESFWTQFEKLIPNIQHIHTVGGEPLLIDQQFTFLEKCVEMGHAHHISVEYNTNLTTIPARAWDLWKHFKVIKLGISIDGIEEVNDYVRFPSKWENIKKNLEKIDNSEGNFTVWWAATIMVYNIWTMPEMFRWKLNKNFKRINAGKNQPIIVPHPLHRPHFLNVQMLPPEAKQAIKAHYQEEKLKFNVYRSEIQYKCFELMDQYIEDRKSVV